MPAGTANVRATITRYERNEPGDIFRVDLFDPTWGLIVSDTGTVHAPRIKVEAL